MQSKVFAVLILVLMVLALAGCPPTFDLGPVTVGVSGAATQDGKTCNVEIVSWDTSEVVASGSFTIAAGKGSVSLVNADGSYIDSGIDANLYIDVDGSGTKNTGDLEGGRAFSPGKMGARDLIMAYSTLTAVE